MDLFDVVIARKLSGGGGGSSITVEPLSVTENNVYTAPTGKAYSPVTVNVSGGSSDFSTAEVTVRFTFTELEDAMTDVYARGITPVIINNSISGVYESSAFNLPAGATSKEIVVSMPLYKNQLITSSFETWNMGDYLIDFENIPTASGNATIDLSNGTAIITGDCTLNIPVAPMY